METTLQKQTTEVGQFNDLPSIMSTAPEILMASKQRSERAITAYDNLIKAIEEDGMNDVHDTNLSTFIEKGKKTITAMNEERKPVTQMITLITKEFTCLESGLKTIIDEAQVKRNTYATEKVKAQQKAQREADEKLAKNKELIDFEKSCEIAASDFFISATTKIKAQIADHFNSLTLETVVKAADSLNSTTTNFDTYYHEGVKIVIPTSTFPSCFRITTEEKAELIEKYTSADYSKQKQQFRAEIELTLKEYIDKLPSKADELKELSLADAAETERLLEEKKKREADEAAQREKEDAEKKANAATQASVSAAGAQAAALVDSAPTLFDTPKVAESYEIKTSNPAGYMMIIQFWYEREGKALTSDKIEKKSVGQMVMFCENWAKKNNEFIESPLITYEPKYKAK